MKKGFTICICGLMMATMMTGCGKKADTAGGESTETVATAAEAGTSEDSVKLGTYKGLTYTPVAAVEVTDEMVESQIATILANNPYVVVDRAAVEGDTVNINYTGLLDGVAFEGGTAQQQNLTLGSDSYIDGFEDGLIGTVQGQEVALDLTFPEDYGNADLAGQAVVFNVTVNAVQEPSPTSLDELTDEFVQTYMGLESVDAYCQALKADMLSYAEETALNQIKSELLTSIIENAELVISDATTTAYYDEQIAAYERQAAGYNTSLETMVTSNGMTLDSFQEQIRTIAEEATKQNAVLYAIAEAENITVTDEDIDQTALELGFSNKEEMLAQAGDNMVNDYIITEKVMDFIFENAVEGETESVEETTAEETTTAGE